MDTKKVQQALVWITDIFTQLGIQFQVTGGLAAQAYGSSRVLHDLDFDVAAGTFVKILPTVEKFVVFGPGEYEESNWSNYLLRLEFEGIVINLSESSTRIFDQEKSIWTDWPVDFESSVHVRVMDLLLPIISKKRLLAYKKVLNRPQDYLDREELLKNA